ncbi:MAG: Asp-tRNA(Asn)/Glu-tRNA(Gln) amidotransferase subunit GatC [Bacteroidota bacterium]
MDVTKESVDQLARLARLNLSEEEKEELAGDLKRILDFVEQLKEVDTDGVKPLIFLNDNTESTRSDESISTITREEAFTNAPDHNEEFFRVPRVINEKGQQ